MPIQDNISFDLFLDFENSSSLQVELIKNGHEILASENVSFIEGDEVTFTCRGNVMKTFLPLGWKVERQNSSSSNTYIGNSNLTYFGTSIRVSGTQIFMKILVSNHCYFSRGYHFLFLHIKNSYQRLETNG